MRIATREGFQILPQKFNYSTRLKLLYQKMLNILEEQQELEKAILNFSGTGNTTAEYQLYRYKTTYLNTIVQIRKLQDIIISVNGIPSTDIHTIKELLKRSI